MRTTAVLFERPGKLSVRSLSLQEPANGDVVVETLVSGVSTGTEKLLFEGKMPSFPGMGYPLVPGYESVGRVLEAGPGSGRKAGELVFVPGASCFKDAAGLFGSTAQHLVVPGSRVHQVPQDLEEEAALLALAATAYHAVRRASGPIQLVIGHGVLGRLIARIILAIGAAPPLVWETNPSRFDGAEGYRVIDPSTDAEIRFQGVVDASGSLDAIDVAVGRMEKQGELVLAGFYGKRVGFEFAPAFMREISLTISAEFRPADIDGVLALIAQRRLSLKGLITHHASPANAEEAYHTAFTNPDCLKMVIDWRRAA
ncbi:chlorophyll synthesis pathway protein BchC [Peteryoungia desertarenae]|uniref:Chlorophyll synthesis pathway protein BchC n=1 Tax=Peteryoungia desertarenae TaxID=1813451 RepID=A0ABX6QJQ7_9HYPH|nr:chlorophyll synthesis pathway protein BchC [Peteryoungia desertarenae]QLF68475.1 chlorophyll synthesis pathway protein BchC [Peteryoungia desertarenae]